MILTRQVETAVGFEFTMAELTEKFGDIADKDVFIKGWLTDFFWLDTFNATAIVKVIRDGIQVKALGKTFSSFKPNTPFSVNVSAGIFQHVCVDNYNFTKNRSDLAIASMSHLLQVS